MLVNSYQPQQQTLPEPLPFHQTLSYTDRPYYINHQHFLPSPTNSVSPARSPPTPVNHSMDQFSPHSHSSSLSMIHSPVVRSPVNCSTNLRFYIGLEAPTAAAQKLEESPLTYLNKGQYYSVTLKDTETSHADQIVKSTIIIMFNDESHRKVAQSYWKFWLSQQKDAQSARAIDIGNDSSYNTSRSSGVHNAEYSSFDRIAFEWNTKKGAVINIRFNCLSTDFSRIKGVKGIPLRLQMGTQVVGEQHIEKAYCRIKLFRDKGAERKNKDDAKHIERKNGEPHPLWLTYSQTQPQSIFREVLETPLVGSTDSHLSHTRVSSTNGSLGSPKSNGSVRSISNHITLPPPTTTDIQLSPHSLKRAYPSNYPTHQTLVPDVRSPDGSTNSHSAWFHSQPQATDIDPTYVVQRRRRIAKLSFFARFDANEVHRAIYLEHLTIQELIGKISAKMNINQQVTRIVRHVSKQQQSDELVVCVDDSVVEDIKEEQAMDVDVSQNEDGTLTLILRY
ncbi:CP2 transcription factor [Phycomyces blakesleeanus NRRL 1555(-)]|uniref:CP2 transcription factor n=1 Tax=Phycomyces blakesleeanus (strain ATCC 8743b / DSM 1359 / FGSC 10004 / NBRC 33097 / NRRL 1555) TaxID=763407 RepID=A0A167QBI2_PHYB8|nr:CP2 transcription factor [Phycomyces blakesleeanus NRRL 1555(-)]OAD79426.1 CP2 transcription factor [Phycomyces blakesleeanus NRRL 1555(-)]|eukprot:XP_018297466.1 CP2 transcription factor [Phycomyces blakesleeanus NRRL 1555(-)]